MLAEFASPESFRLNRLGQLSSAKKVDAMATLDDVEELGSEYNVINHQEGLSKDFATFIDDEALSDFRIRVSAGKSAPQTTTVEIKAHKIILAARCPYF